MSPLFRPVCTAALRHVHGSRVLRRALLLATSLIVSGCAAAPLSAAGPDPADPDVRVPPATYRSSLRDFRRIELAEPPPWTGGAVAPRREKGQP